MGIDYNSQLPAGNKTVKTLECGTQLHDAEIGSTGIQLSVFDILKTNINFRSNVNGNTVYTNQTNTLPQYFMLTATYNVRPYGATKKKVWWKRWVVFVLGSKKRKMVNASAVGGTPNSGVRIG